MFGIVIVGFCLAAFLLLCYLYYKKADADCTTLLAERLGASPEHALAEKVIWIVGASSGIGEYVAYELSQYPCKLVLSARRTDELDRVKVGCLAMGTISTDDIMVLPMDILKTNEHGQLFQQVLDKFNKLDILLNNVGRTQRARWEEISLEVDREMFELDVFSIISLTRTVYPHFIKREEGHVVVTSSVAGLVGVPGSASYCGAKHALHGYMESLRLEKFRDNIAVTILCPGPVHSNLLETAFTGKPGEVYNKAWSNLDLRMDTSRCAKLCVVAIANQLQVSWISLNPVLLLLYFRIYFPTLSLMALERSDYKNIHRLRDGSATGPQIVPGEKVA